MKYRIFTLAVLLSCIPTLNWAQNPEQDWAQLNKYQTENQQLMHKAPDSSRVVFMGNSITEAWKDSDPDFFQHPSYINRGISGQTTPQMLIRFRPDVINLKPAVVVILAGINDIAGNTGPMTLEETFGNIQSMVQLAKAHQIEVVLCSVLPANHFPWSPEIEPADQVIALNQMLQELAAQENLVYVDYYKAMADEKKGLDSINSYDGVHPTPAGYKIMKPLIETGIQQALIKRKNT
ncbi:SGNH/GDSL hydrolase family protein [Croceiramulus getboli]|nr:SGNH/GDSL hydrolase family protein [Flavobacteriaceae bacterium YJPT1-3]